MAIDESKLNEFLGKLVGDLGAVMHAATSDRGKVAEDPAREALPAGQKLTSVSVGCQYTS